jgi:TM2 domain-containing membrane protein YozV
MKADQEIYDLGEVAMGKPSPVFSGVKSSPKITRFHHERPQPPGVRPGLAGSLSMFVPGLGQMVTGEIAWGAFYLSWMAFCGACLWALLDTLDRIDPTLRLFNLPPEILGCTLATLALVIVTIHLSAIVHAQSLAAIWDSRFAAHPLVAALASLLLPGWGQLLAGHRRRAVLFLGALWILGAAWLLVTPAGTRVLSRVGLTLPAAMRDGWGPAVMLSAPVVLWVIAVYDAAAGAAAERRA